MHCSHGVKFLLIVALLFLSVPAMAQVDTVRGDVFEDDSAGFQMTKSPMLALGLSAILPGAGQIYNEQWWKVPILYAMLGGFGYGAYIQNQRYQDAKANLAKAIAEKNEADASTWTRSRNFYRDDRDKFFIYMGLAYVANLIDAYISAHLFDFDVSDPAPLPAGTSPIRVGITVPLR
jgi:hypothetical protein